MLVLKSLMKFLIYSFAVCEKVESKGRTTYNEVFNLFFPMYPISSLAVCVVTLYSIIFAQLIQYSSQQTLGTDCHYCTTVHTDAPLKFYCFRSKPKMFLLVIWYALLLYGFWAKDLVSPFIYTTTVAFSYFVNKGWYALNDSLLATSF